MQAIASSAKEQSTALAEVNAAINQMDQTTQQNAALVEESNAASATLAQETDKLRRLVDGFKLEGGHRSSVNASQSKPTVSHASQVVPPTHQMIRKLGTALRGNAVAKEQAWEDF